MLAETMAQLAEDLAFDSFTAPFMYEGMAMNLVKSLKYGGQRPAARLMAQQMLPYLENGADLIMCATGIKKNIIGVKNYSLRTVDLSNGMKIKFTNSLVLSAYQDKEYYVEGVGEAITLTDVDELINVLKDEVGII